MREVDRTICYFVNSDWYFKLHWLERARAAQKSGYNIHIISNASSADIEDFFKKEKFEFYNSKISEHSLNPFAFFISLVKIFFYLAKIKPHVLHCITIKPCVMGGIIALLLRIPVVLSVVGLGRVFSSHEKNMRFLRYIVIFIYKLVIINRKSIFSFEHIFDRNILCDLLGKKIRTIVIDGAGVNTGEYPYTPEKKSDIPIVLFASRMLWSKGIGDLVKAGDLIRKQGVDFELKVAGILSDYDNDGVPENILKKWHQQGKITWLGKQDDVCSLIKESSLVVLPSYYSEGVPRILLEAASVGRACICYDVNGCRSLLINDISGKLIPVADIQLLAYSLMDLILQPEQRAFLGKNARKIVESKFSSEIVIRATLEMYDSLVSLN